MIICFKVGILPPGLLDGRANSPVLSSFTRSQSRLSRKTSAIAKPLQARSAQFSSGLSSVRLDKAAEQYARPPRGAYSADDRLRM